MAECVAVVISIFRIVALYIARTHVTFSITRIIVLFVNVPSVFLMEISSFTLPFMMESGVLISPHPGQWTLCLHLSIYCSINLIKSVSEMRTLQNRAC